MPPAGATELLPTHTAALFEAAVQRAAALLRQGELVALPTETVYGLAAHALNPDAVARIFRIKGRPAHNPIIVHVADTALARRCCSQWPDNAEQLARAFWPGPLTLVLPRHPGIPDAVTAGGGTVGIRWPSHPFIQAVIRACGFPLAAPSANLSNQVSPTTAQHVLRSLAGRIPLVVDGGASHVGIESTVLDLTPSVPQVLRPGMISVASLSSVLGTVGIAAAPTGNSARRSPGQLEKHYAPRAPLRVLPWTHEAELQDRLSAAHPTANRPRKICVVAHTHIPGSVSFLRVSVVPHDPEAFARALYAELHACDDAGAELIVVEALPDTPEWHGIADRLRRAATPG